MIDPAIAPQLLIWTEARRVPLVRRLVAHLGDSVRVSAIGGPKRGEVAELAESLGADTGDDLRQIRLDHRGGCLLLAGMAGVKRDDLAAAVAEGMNVFTLEPLAGSGQAPLPHTEADTAAGKLVQLPLLRYSPAFRAAAEPTEALGDVQVLSLTSLGRADEFSLLARLVDAMDFALHLIGVPDQIDATLTGGLVEPPEQLRGLAGHMTVNLHRADQAGAALCVSDRAPVHHRAAVIVGRAGYMTMDDRAYALHTDSEQPLDHQPADADPLEPTQLIADQLLYHLRHGIRRDPVDRRTILGCCEAALLSTRTGQSESTDRVLRIA